ncbi:MAG: bifunctional DNA primase/polymerase [Armatimonadetes bacterium]|nr:bifunctional DNA primase/polymerase [Armatimonadota bacterium]
MFCLIPIHSVKNGKCSCGNPDCDSPGKHPRIPNWKEYQARRPTAEELARWRKQFPGCNWAVVTGQVSGVIVLDVDGPEGAEAVKGKHLPLTWAVQTGKGIHYYFKHPGFSVPNGVRVLPGVDVRGDGGYVVAPGSVHASGRKYAWVPGMNPEDLPDGPAPCPKWLLELLQGKRQPGGKREKVNPVNVLNGVPEGLRDTTLFRYACRLRTQGLTKEEALRLVLEAARNSQPPFPEETAKEKVESAWKYQKAKEEAQKLNLPSGISAQELINREFPDPLWVVPGLLPEGLAILAGRPKIGKSWLALGVAVAVASGGIALGQIKVEKANVLYLALEDGPRRLKNRLTSVLQGEEAPQGLHFFTEFPRLDQGGLQALEDVIQAHNAKLLIVDTVVKLRPPGRRNSNVYQEDYAVMGALKTLADRHNAAILVLHHQNKQGYLDILDSVSGSTGVTGAADTTWILRRSRGKADAELFAVGRDFEEKELALEFDRHTTSWYAIGNAEEYRLSQERREIIEILRENGGTPMSPNEIAAILDKPYNAVKKLVYTMSKSGELKSVTRGRYIIGNFGNHGNFGNGGNFGNFDEKLPEDRESYRESYRSENPERLRPQDFPGKVTKVTEVTNNIQDVPDDFWENLKSKVDDFPF